MATLASRAACSRLPSAASVEALLRRSLTVAAMSAGTGGGRVRHLCAGYPREGDGQNDCHSGAGASKWRDFSCGKQRLPLPDRVFPGGPGPAAAQRDFPRSRRGTSVAATRQSTPLRRAGRRRVALPCAGVAPSCRRRRRSRGPICPRAPRARVCSAAGALSTRPCASRRERRRCRVIRPAFPEARAASTRRGGRRGGRRCRGLRRTARLVPGARVPQRFRPLPAAFALAAAPRSRARGRNCPSKASVWWVPGAEGSAGHAISGANGSTTIESTP